MDVKRYERLIREGIEGKTIERLMGVNLPSPSDNYNGVAMYFLDGTYVLLCIRQSSNGPLIDRYDEEISNEKYRNFLDTAGYCDDLDKTIIA